MAVFRCPENHILRRSPAQVRHGRTKCGWCGRIVSVVPCPEAAPKPWTRRNEYSVSIMRQRARDNLRRRGC